MFAAAVVLDLDATGGSVLVNSAYLAPPYTVTAVGPLGQAAGPARPSSSASTPTPALVRTLATSTHPYPPRTAAVEAIVEAPFGQVRIVSTHLEYYSAEHRAPAALGILAIAFAFFTGLGLAFFHAAADAGG